jgi:aspartate racemase
MISKKTFASTHASKAPGKHRYGVVGGLGVIAGADLLLKMIGATQRRPEMRDVGIAFEQRHFDSGPSIADATYNPSRRKFYVYNTLKEMEARGIDTALVPCFVSHTFLREITPELDMRVISLFDALRDWLAREHPALHTIGVLTSTYVQKSGIFERELGFPVRDRLSGCGRSVRQADARHLWSQRHQSRAPRRRVRRTAG